MQDKQHDIALVVVNMPVCACVGGQGDEPCMRQCCVRHAKLPTCAFIDSKVETMTCQNKT